MDKTIDTLVEDINDLLERGISSSDVDPSTWTDLGTAIAGVIKEALVDRSEREGTLRMSNIGKPCNRQVWYSVNTPNDGERLGAAARLKFLYGHILEELLVTLVKLSGHKVEARQEEVEIEGIKGHWDGIVDGVVVDFKSASTYSFKKFKEGKLSQDDPFGYQDQIQSYLKCGQDDDRVIDKERCGFVIIDKTLGNICLDIHKRDPFPIEKVYQYKKEMVNDPEPPARGFDDVAEGASGNRKLGINCSYCDFRHNCWPGLRTFLYSGKPVALTVVKREPKVPELKGKDSFERSEEREGPLVEDQEGIWSLEGAV